MKSINILIIIGHLIPFTLRAATLNFETAEEVDKQFIEKNEKWIQDQYLKLESYFNIKPRQPITVQVLPVSKNPDFKSCARVYGTKRIYVHSPNSLSALTSEQRKKYDSFCFQRDYEELKYTLVHEYIHILKLLKQMDTNPKWLWEGAAVALSGQLKHTQMGQIAKYSVSRVQKIDICNVEIADNDAYLVGGAALNYYETKNPGFIRDLINSFANNPKKNVHLFIRKRNLNCEVSSQDIGAAI